VILSSANDSNWRTRSATLTYLRTFMYRYGFGFVLLFYFCIAIFFFFFWLGGGGGLIFPGMYGMSCSDNFCFRKLDIGVSILSHEHLCFIKCHLYIMGDHLGSRHVAPLVYSLKKKCHL
jgi:hypothetical protein